MDDFYIWVNEQIAIFISKLKRTCKTSKQFLTYREKFSDYCTECINTYEERLELESNLKYEIVRESIKLLREIEYCSSM